jgi:DNA-binding GntR family transcriptional regulator
VSRELLEDRIYRYLYSQLKSHRLELGTHLKATVIAQTLEVSRTTVRKAIIRLVEDGCVKLSDGGRPIVIALPKKRRPMDDGIFAYSNQTENAYWAVFDLILDGRLREGENVNGQELAEANRVSVGTIRQALDWLCRDGLLQRLPRRGWKVVHLDERDLVDAFKIRIQFEPEVLARAMDQLSREQLERVIADNERVLREGDKVPEVERRRVDYQFHWTLLDASRSPVLMQTIDPLVRKCMLTGLRIAVPMSVATVAYLEHIEIGQALIRKDIDQASSILQKHLIRSMQLHERIILEQSPQETRTPA